MIKDANVLITGGAGFIGSTLCRSLLRNGNHVTIFDNFSRDAITGTDIINSQNLKIVRGDITTKDDLNMLDDSYTHIVHCAGIAGIDTVIIDPVRTIHVNFIGSENILSFSRNMKRLKRVVCLSTSEVLGEYAMGATELDKSVIGVAGEARWTYAVSKLAEEHLALAYHRQHKIPVTIVRPFNVYGPGQVGTGAIHAFVRRAICNQDLEIHGEGTQIRAWCYVDDMVQALLLTLERDAAVGQIFNIGNHRSAITILGLANLVIRVLGSKSRIIFTNRDYADVELRIPSTKKAEQILGFRALVDLDEGILRTAEFYRQKVGLV
jgi:UDP-glucose 4-epimerase